MKQLAENLWIFDGEAVPFFTLPYTTRMTVIRLNNGALWVHSPIKLTPELQALVEALGEVRYLIAPNHLHHLFLQDWQQTYPQAQSFGTSEVQTKRPDLHFDGLFTAEFQAMWATDIDQLLFTGSHFMQECVFFHKASGTLIVTDLIENFSPDAFNALQRFLARGAGILAPNGKMPLDWRLSFMFAKQQARTHLVKMLAWEPQRIVMAHGLIVEQDAKAFLQRSFAWLEG
ncbi:DUF4336 domain-containing protein [Shewanella sp. HN-41]|uniref:DUF4336 domain-containing protein n=1 Tax=Shewanella sp. HN-41 TaxID=327275 RepID=UPI000212619E|nr:DUF4336 domain-containing protein [Shewanella sp. HN-41]EGM68695.1 hypothetical protein SOHN41_03367 [Shewanella sp. HN-41]